MTVRRLRGQPPLALHAAPVGGNQATFRPRDVAALLAVGEPGAQPGLDAGLVADSLGLTPVECDLVMSPAESRTVRDMAAATGRQEDSIGYHLKRIYRKHGLAGHADLVRLLLALRDSLSPQA